MRADRVLTGRRSRRAHDEALWRRPSGPTSSSRSIPNQKERIILSLKKMGHVVGFLGDGVNDAPAMHAADTSLSVEQAVDVAREAADFVLLERDLDVIRRGIEEGRKTFANTLKYILITTSANLGNMVSMAAASLFLPFLPLTAGTDSAQQLSLGHPGRRHRGRQRRSGARGAATALGHRVHRPLHGEFGLVSSVFDFADLWRAARHLPRATPATFRTGWFVESLLTELVVALVVRTRRPFFRSRPGTLLLRRRLSLIAVAFAIPYLPFAAVVRLRAASGRAARGHRRDHRALRRGDGAAEAMVLPIQVITIARRGMVTGRHAAVMPVRPLEMGDAGVRHLALRSGCWTR